MRITKNVLSIILVIAMLLTAAPMSVYGFAIGDTGLTVDSEDDTINTAQSDTLIRPNATLSVTPVTRVTYSTASPFKLPDDSHSVIIAATPSGIPKASFKYVAAAYAGETPTSTTITFTPGVAIDINTLSIKCDNASVKFSQVAVNNGVYTWTVADGATAAVGSTLVFTVSYQYSYKDTQTGKTYNSGKVFTTTGYSYVESIVQPAGIYSYRRTWVNALGIHDTKNRAYFSSFVLGAATYNESRSTGKSANFDGDTPTSNYGNMLIVEDDGGTEKTFNVGFGNDSVRPVSHVYMDKSANTTLADMNLRVQTYIPKVAGDSKERVTVSTNGIYEYAGSIKTYDGKLKEKRLVSNSTSTDLSLVSSTTKIQNVGETYLMNFSGAGPAQASASSDTTSTYTMLIDYHTPAAFSAVYLRHTFNVVVTVFNKGTLRSNIQRSQNTDPSNYLVASGTNDGKGYNPQEWYYADGWQGYIGAYNYAQSILAKPNTTQSDITAAATNLAAAYNSLVLKEADYTEADYYVGRANALDKTLYTNASWAKLEAALAKYQKGYNIIYQPKLDQIAIDIKNALDSLELADADYTAPNEKVGIINGLVADARSSYDLAPTELYSNWSVVDDAVKACGYTYDSAESEYVLTTILKKDKQSEVDAYAITIQTAINKLKKNSADYTKATEAAARYNSFKNTNVNYLTDASLKAIDDAYNKLNKLIGQALTIEHQSEIDTAAAALNTALDNVQYKAADLTAARKAIARADALERSNYQDLTAVDNAYSNLASKLGLDARYQSQIDTATEVLNRAIDNLKEITADYSAVKAAIATVNAENERITKLYKDSYGFTANEFYSNWGNVVSAVNAVVEGLPISKQATVDAYAKAITDAYNARTIAPADITKLLAAEAQAETYINNESYYTEVSMSRLMSAYLAVPAGTFTIDQQARVDAYTKAILDAIAQMEYVGADYTDVNTAITNANTLIKKSEDFANAHNGVPYYTDETINALKDAINAVDWSKNITQQAEVKIYADAINNAANALVPGDADYAEVRAALASIPSDLDSGRYTVASVAAVKAAKDAVVYGLKTNRQTAVDGYASAIENAVKNLTPNGADYTCVTQAIAKIPADSSKYTAGSWKRVTDAKNAVVYDLSIDEQDRVNAYAQAILDAIDNLEEKEADYTSVEIAKAAAKAALESTEAQYYTDASKAAVTTAVNAVVYGLKGSEQARVDGFADAINKAVAALAYKPIDKTGLNAAIARIPSDLSIYTDDTVNALNIAKSAAEAFAAGDVNIKNQAELDAFVAELNKAIDGLAYKDADYSGVRAAIAEADALDSSLYVDFSGVTAAKGAVVYGYNITKQAEVDAMAKAIRDAITALEFKALDTSAYEAAKITVPADITIYTDTTVKAVTDAEAAITEFLSGDVDIRNQAQFDALVKTYVDAIANLALKGASYDALKAKIDEFKALNELDYTNYNEAYAVYSEVNTWYKANGNLTTDKQSLIDEQTAKLQAAIDSLIPVPTSYFRAKADSTCIIKGQYIYGLKTNLTTAQLKALYLDYYNVELTIVNPKGYRYLGTGSTVTVKYPDGKEDVYTIVIYGDINGDGKIAAEDVSILANKVSGQYAGEFTTAQNIAANVDGSRRVDAADVSIIAAAVSGKKTINQTGATK